MPVLFEADGNEPRVAGDEEQWSHRAGIVVCAVIRERYRAIATGAAAARAIKLVVPSIGVTMTQRIDYSKVGPDAYKAVLGLETYVRHSGLEHSLIELVKLRASYINGCAYCVDMHSKDALAAGETPQRILAVPVWRETPFSRRASVPPPPSPKRSHSLRATACRTMSTSRRRSTSRRKSS